MNKSYGLYGFYEAIDFTPDRLLIGENSAVVHEYMSHHQGMILMALVNYFHADIMVKRMHSDPRIQSVELLLQEQVPLARARPKPVYRRRQRHSAPGSRAGGDQPMERSGPNLHSAGAPALEWQLQRADLEHGQRLQPLAGHRSDPLAG